MNYEDSVQWLSGLRRFGIKLGLERFQKLLRVAGDPHLAFKSVHVAGTNGKGSVTSMVAEGAQASGLKTGRYLSPYVFDIRERVQINGEMIPRREFATLATEAQSIIESVPDGEFGETTEFEAKTLIGFLYFARENVDVACIEVGLGGRLDATNVIVPMVSVITSISYDHMDRLGDTLAQIASEKAGIIKQGVPVVSGVTDLEPASVIRRIADERKAPLTSVESYGAFASIFRPSDRIYYYKPSSDSPVTLIRGAWELAGLRMRLQGDFQASNAGCAAGALLLLRQQRLPVSDEAIKTGIERAWLPGRLQILSDSPLVIADGAHNPAGAQVLAQYLGQRLEGRRLTLVFAMTKPHKPAEFLTPLLPFIREIVVTTVSTPNAWSVEELAAELADLALEPKLEVDPAEAIRYALESAGSDEAVCITGSFFLVGAIPQRQRGNLDIMAKDNAADDCLAN
ncbi:MAG: bifunctional folylpolyglutamate synthase/dihydrofolate synthase [Armatimonadetes bacterium]|nr:bifunctional folylpolyglutamate synthase/dihydrofolate synthase [Armatimonadota bacterium]